MPENKSTESMMLRGALVPTFIVGIIGIGLSSFIVGSDGFFGALLAQFVVLIYFLVNFFNFCNKGFNVGSFLSPFANYLAFPLAIENS